MDENDLQIAALRAEATSELGSANRSVDVAVVIVLFAFALLLTNAFFLGATDWTEVGAIGDSIGGHLAAGGSIAGFVLMFAAFRFQSAELKLQRVELIETRRFQSRLADAEADSLAFERARALDTWASDFKAAFIDYMTLAPPIDTEGVRRAELGEREVRERGQRVLCSPHETTAQSQALSHRETDLLRIER